MPKEKPELSDAMKAKMSRKLPQKNPIKGTKFTIAISSAKYPSPRWLQICRSSNTSSWLQNKTSDLKSFLKVNGFDILYL